MASTDSAEDNRAFAEKNGASFPILSDPAKTMTSAYGVLSPGGYARRWTVYIDPDGVIERIDKAVDPRTAGAGLVQHLEELAVPRKADPSSR